MSSPPIKNPNYFCKQDKGLPFKARKGTENVDLPVDKWAKVAPLVPSVVFPGFCVLLRAILKKKTIDRSNKDRLNEVPKGKS